MVSPCLHRARIERILVAPTRTPLTSGIVVYNYWQVSGAEVRGKFVIRQPCPGREHFPCARAYTLPRGLRTDVNYYRQFRETNTPSTPSPCLLRATANASRATVNCIQSLDSFSNKGTRESPLLRAIIALFLRTCRVIVWKSNRYCLLKIIISQSRRNFQRINCRLGNVSRTRGRERKCRVTDDGVKESRTFDITHLSPASLTMLAALQSLLARKNEFSTSIRETRVLPPIHLR